VERNIKGVSAKHFLHYAPPYLVRPHLEYANTGLVKFHECDKFIASLTCTQKLQTFYRTKKHLGTPIKAANLPVRISENTDFDPRPREFVKQESYPTFFNNTVINSGVICTAPICQILQPANPLAVLNDNDYEHKPDPIESFLQSETITQINQAQIDTIQHTTIGQSNNLDWKTERLKQLTSSTFGRICKIRNLSKAHEMHESLQQFLFAGNRSLSPSISSQFILLQPKIAKKIT